MHKTWFEYGNPKRQFINKVLSLHYFIHCFLKQNHAFVAKEDGKVVGCILFRDKNTPKHSVYKLLYKLLTLLIKLNPLCKEGFEVHNFYRDNYAALIKEHNQSYDSEIVLLIVASNMQGKHIGKNLITFAENYLKSEGLKQVFLLTDTSCNFAFYHKLGYERMAEHLGGFLYDGQKDPEYFYLYKKVLN